MNKKDEKVIPTLDDIIKTGVSDNTRIGDLSSFDDGSYDAEFEEIYLTRHLQQPVKTSAAARDVSNKSQARESSAFSDHNTIADQIVAERFPDEASQLRQNTRPASTTSKAAAPETPKSIKPQTPPTTALKPAPVAPAKINISKLVEEITEQLMPEIETKVRTRVRDILEQRFPAKK